MLQFINSIPEVVGWHLVGIAGVAAAIMLGLLVKTFVQMWKDWHEDSDEESECDEIA